MIHNLLEGFKVIFDPNKTIANKGEVLVGLGNTQVENIGLALQHKTVKNHYESLSQYVSHLNFNDAINDYDTFFIEDYSIDTVLSIWLFLYKLNYKAVSGKIDLWIDYVSRWERGDTSTTGEAFESYGCLQNSLALSMRHSDPVEILAKSLSFLDYLINHNINPSDINTNLQVRTYQNAYLALQKEYVKYEKLISSSEVKILYIPKIESSDLKKVSGIFIETNLVTSIQKVFLRNDKKSPTEDGYALMSIYNSSAKGSGNDIVISVDPVKNIHLKVLWEEIEREEELLWSGERPKDNPRPLASYPHNNGPNQPWWDDMGNYTLIAAPKMVGNEYGRRLSWKRVQQLIKQLYAKGAQS